MWKQKITSLITWRPTSLFSSKPWQRVRAFCLHILLPNTCYHCACDLSWNNTHPLCKDCEQQLQPVGPLYCLRCGKPLPDGGAHCYDCRGTKGKQYACKVIRSALVFNPVLRPLVHAFKYADRPYLADYLAQWMNVSWQKYPDLAQVQVLVPVPLHPKKQKQRRYNQSELLARALAHLQGLPVDSACLIRVRNTPSQTQFGRAGRLENMRGAFRCEQPANIKGKIVLLIDDVATTGATLEGCAEALKAAGAKKVIAYTLAREV